MLLNMKLLAQHGLNGFGGMEMNLE